MRWIVKRAVMAFITIYVVVTFTFIVVKSMPGDPIEALTQAFIR